MKTDVVRAARRANLKAALEQPGVVRRSVGEAMGWSDGSFLGQMTSGRRPITEELARLLEPVLGLEDGSLDRPPGQYAKITGASPGPAANKEDAMAAAAALTLFATILSERRAPPDPVKVGKAAEYLAEQAARMGGLSKKQVRSIIDKLV